MRSAGCAKIFGVMVILLGFACGDEGIPSSGGSPQGSESALGIAGEYTDDFGVHHRISNDAWIQSGSDFRASFAVLGFSNRLRYVVAQNDAENAFNPSAFSRFEWTLFGPDLHYCQVAFAETSQAVALAVPRADELSQDSGCGGFSWTKLGPVTP